MKLSTMTTIFLFSIFASAHAHLQHSNPANGAVLKELPASISMKFSEPLEIAMSKIEVKNSKSGELINETTTLGTDESSLQSNFKKTKKEKIKYDVTWKAVSKDSHTMRGAYSFTVDPK